MARRRARSADPDAPPPRRMRGFEAAATLLAPRLRQGAESRGFAVARLLTHWPEIVGAATAAHTRPVKVAHGKEFGATLTILTDGAHAPLVQMEKGMVVQSGNDAAIALAEHVAGSEEAFAALMNQYAARIGLKNSHFMKSARLR